MNKRLANAAATHACPALIISGTSSGQGKTLITAALARYYVQRGLLVRVFKIGPDFLDPMILEQASGHPVYQLDLFMVGEADCRQLLFDAAGSADLLLIEGVMGLFDGQPSSADLAALFDIPVLAVINAAAMAQTFGALAHGLATYRPDIRLAGVLANRVGSERHAQMLQQSLPPDIRWFGALPRAEAFVLPERHLGLVQAAEMLDLDERIEAAAAALGQALDAAGNTLPGALPKALEFCAPQLPAIPPLLSGKRIAIAQDAAFSFIYPANLDCLTSLGAELIFFSPLVDAQLPSCDALWLPGGYPELHLTTLSGNTSMKNSIVAHHAAHKPILAECGGMLYLAESLTHDQQTLAMVGLLPAKASLQKRLVALGLQSVDFPANKATNKANTLRGHTFHYSRLETQLKPFLCATNPNHPSPETGEAVYRIGKLTAAYIHFYFSSNPAASACLFL